MFDTNNPSKLNPWLPVSIVLAIALTWTLVFMFIKLPQKTTRIWYETTVFSEEINVPESKATALWQLQYNLAIPCYKLDPFNGRVECLEQSAKTSVNVLSTKTTHYQFKKCQEGLYWNYCETQTPLTTEHLKIFDSLVAIQNKYREN